MPETTKASVLFNGNGGPWWAKVLVSIGPMAGLVVFLVWWVTQSVSVALASHAVQSELALETLITISRQICHNAADTEDEHAGCGR